MGTLKFDITGDNTSVLKAFRGVQEGVSQTARVVEQQGQSIENVFNRIKSVATLAFGGFTAKEIVSTIGAIRGEFQQFEIAFETMLGSGQKAKAMISDLAKLAATTPFDMKGVVNGAKQLLAYGFAANEITETMRRLGDVSAGLGLNLQDLTWLYGTTMVQGRLFTRDLMQFTGRGIPLTEELAKQFGVTKDKVSELVTAGKVGFPEVKKAIESLTNEGGKFGGLMEKQSHSITGQISNIQDTIEMAINDLGTQTEGLMNDALDITSTVIDHWKEIGEVILAAASAIGLYKAMAVSVAAFDTATANVGYAAELSALDALLPKKEEVKKTDLEEAVAKGQLSAAQAELVASKREEVAAYVAELQTKAKVMQDEVHVLENKLALQDNEVQSLQDAYDALDDYVSAEVRDTAATNLNTAANERNNIANQLKAAREKAATAATNANTASQGLNTAATARDTATKGIWAQVTLLCEKAQRAWNASMFSSPLFLIAATIAAVTYAVYKLATAESAHETAVRKSNEAWDEFDNKVKERQQNIESLIRTIQSETATEFEKAEAYQKLSNLAPQLTDQYDQAAIASLDFSKAQKEVAESMDESKYDKAVEDVKKYKEEVKKLQQLITSDATYNGGGQGIILSRQLEQAQASLDQAEDKLSNIIQLRDQAAENAKPIELRLQEAQENESVRQDIFDFYDEAMALANDWQKANEIINYATGESRLNAFINKAQKEIAELRDDIKKNPADLNLRMQESEKTKALNNLLAMKRNWAVTGATTIPLIFRAQWNTAKQALNQAKTKTQALAHTGSTETYQQAYNKAQREYNAAKKKVAAMERNKSKYTASQYETATQDLKAAKDAYSKLGGDVSGKSAKAAVTARKNRIKEENRAIKVQEELNSRLKTLQQKNTDETISLMQEGTEKKLAQIKNDYAKRNAEIDKQEAEFKKKNKEAGNKVTLTSAQSDALTEARKLAKQNFDKQTAEVNKESLDAMRDYLKEYGSLYQQKQAIAEEYEEKIAKAQTEGEKKTLQQEKKKALANFDYESISMGIDWKGLMSGVGNMSKEMLKPMLEKLDAYTNTDKFQQADTQTQQKVVDLMQEIRTYLGTDQNATWQNLAASISSFNQSVAEYQKAVEEEKRQSENFKSTKALHDKGSISDKELQQAKKATDDASQAVVDAKNKMNTFGIKLNSATEAVTNYTSGLTAALNKLGTWKGNEGFSEVQSSVGNIDALKGVLDESLSTIGNGVAKTMGATISKGLGSALDSIGGGITNMMGSALGSIVGVVAQIPKLILNLASSIKGFVTGILDSFTQLLQFEWLSDLVDSILASVGNLIDAIFDLPENLFKALESIVVNGVGGLLDNVLGRVGNILSLGALSSKGPSDWFTNSNAEKVQKAINRLTSSNERLQKSIDKLKDTMTGTYGKESTNAYKEAKQQQETYNHNVMEIAKQQMSYHGSHHSWSSYWSGFNDEQLAKIRKNVKSDFNGDITTLTPEEMKKLLSDQDLVDKIRGTGEHHKGRSAYGEWVLDKLEDYADLAGNIDELTEQWRESITQISFDSMKDNFISNLMDMSKSAQEFSDDFAEMMQKALLSYSMEDLMNGDLKKLYEDWADAIDAANGDSSKIDIDAFNKRYDDIVQEGMKRRDDWAKVTGYTGSSSSSQTATSGGWASMGQDTADELNGRFTALQIAGESIAQNMTTTISQMESIVTLGISTNGAVLEIRNMMIMTNSYLEDIVKYAKLTYNEFGTKMDDMNKRLKEI
jgi:chromosome segregation ATPase|nr:MAG TPA: tail tape measure protein [Caudoviricetes sp.]